MGKSLAVPLRQPDGQWLFVMDTWNAEALVAMPEWQAGVLDRTSAGTNRPQ